MRCVRLGKSGSANQRSKNGTNSDHGIRMSPRPELRYKNNYKLKDNNIYRGFSHNNSNKARSNHIINFVFSNYNDKMYFSKCEISNEQGFRYSNSRVLIRRSESLLFMVDKVENCFKEHEPHRNKCSDSKRYGRIYRIAHYRTWYT